MNQRNRPRRRAPDGIDEAGWLTVLAVVLAAPLTACIGIVYLLHAVEFGPGVGDIVAFDSSTDSRALAQLLIPVGYASTTDNPTVSSARSCVLSPAVMAASGGSLVIEAKEITRPPSYRVHWAGPRTDQGADDCGSSADLTVPLKDLRVLANAAGGFGVGHKHGVF